ncbi:hypothetical protein N7535_007421 [Penicillium sp. DV-2018c]|nr:hypothetical protein N7461_003448 [Penicillium sp. DV-2018c]KAJ5565783.1 hypothetical protein N7535_007421 [Penicillium sp. DV-2018c]
MAPIKRSQIGSPQPAPEEATKIAKASKVAKGAKGAKAARAVKKVRFAEVAKVVRFSKDEKVAKAAKITKAGKAAKVAKAAMAAKATKVVKAGKVAKDAKVAKVVKRAKPEEPEDPEEASNPAPKRRKTGNLHPKTSDNPTNPDLSPIAEEKPDPAHRDQVVVTKHNSPREFRPIPDEDLIQQYKQNAVQYERWMTDTRGKGCPVRISTLTYNLLTQNDDKERRLGVSIDKWTTHEPGYEYHVEKAELPTADDTWHEVSLVRGFGKADGTGQLYRQRITRGAIVGENINRNGSGPYWSDVALAVYKYHHPIDTLKHVFFAGVWNNSTEPLITKVLYPDADLKVPEGEERGVSDSVLWTPYRKNRGFYEIMGSTLGKSAASIVLGAWPRGTHRISAIWTWFINSVLQIRFDIEEIEI